MNLRKLLGGICFGLAIMTWMLIYAMVILQELEGKY